MWTFYVEIMQQIYIRDNSAQILWGFPWTYTVFGGILKT